MDVKLIKARRKAIQADARCDGCGATLASCKANRGRDETAPRWFGCCARGLEMGPCNHVVSSAALIDLLKEIEKDRVRSLDDELLDSIEEFPLLKGARLYGNSLRSRVLAMAVESWPDDVPMRGHF